MSLISAKLKLFADYAVRKLSEHPLLWSFLITLAVFAVYIPANSFGYYINDDRYISMLLSGGDINGVFVHSAFCFLVSWLYPLFPSVNWIMFAFLLLLYFAVVSIFHLFLLKLNPYRLLIGLSALFLTSSIALYMFTFTLVSYVSMFAGILLIYYTFFHEEKPRRLKLIFGSLLIVFAIMIRQDISFPLIISALMLLSLEIATRSKLRAIFSLRRRGKISRQEGSVSPLREPLKSRIKNAGGDIKKLLCFALICLLLFAMRYPLSAIDSLAYRSDEWQAYKTYNLARNKLYDYPKTDETMDILQEIGLTDNDIEMLYGYYFYDKQLLFDEDNLELLSQISTSSDFSLGSIFGRFKNSFYSFSFALEHRGFRPMLFFMFIIGIGLLLLVSDKRSTLLYLLLSIEVGLNICVFLVLGRYPTRVTVPTALFALLAFMLYMAENTDKIKRRKRTLAFWGGLCAVCASIFILLPNFIAVSHAPVKPDYMDDVINSPKTVYILSDDRSFDYSISWMENPLSPENLVYTESWSMYSPISEARMKESGVDGNPLIYMLDNENVVYMTSWMPRIQAISIYLYEHHGIIAIAEPIAEYESGMVFYKFKTVPEDGEMPSYLKEYLERVN